MCCKNGLIIKFQIYIFKRWRLAPTLTLRYLATKHHYIVFKCVRKTSILRRLANYLSLLKNGYETLHTSILDTKTKNC